MPVLNLNFSVISGKSLYCPGSHFSLVWGQAMLVAQGGYKEKEGTEVKTFREKQTPRKLQ